MIEEYIKQNLYSPRTPRLRAWFSIALRVTNTLALPGLPHRLMKNIQKGFLFHSQTKVSNRNYSWGFLRDRFSLKRSLRKAASISAATKAAYASSY